MHKKAMRAISESFTELTYARKLLRMSVGDRLEKHSVSAGSFSDMDVLALVYPA